jgi:hypothetical protein
MPITTTGCIATLRTISDSALKPSKPAHPINRREIVTEQGTGASADADQALVASDQAASRLAPTGFDPSREQLIHRIIVAIASASVPHESQVLGALESRSLSYYLGVGIDHFGHDYARHEALLHKAAEQVVAALKSAKLAGGPDWKLVHAVRSGALDALRHCNVDEELFATVASATYAPIRDAIAMEARQGRDGETRLDGEAATARAEGIAHNPSSTPRDKRE